MITGTWIIGDQIRYMKNKDIGFQKEQVLGIRTSDRKILQTLDQVKSRLMEIPDVLEASAASYVPGQGQDTNAIVPEDFEGNTSMVFRVVDADADYVRTMGMKIVRGRDFSRDLPSDAQDSVIINETAVRKLGWDNPIGKTIKIAVGLFQYKTKKVIGVVRDFKYASLRDTVEPLYIDNEMSHLYVLAVKLKTNNIGRLIGEIRKAWTTISPGSHFDYFFIDELFDAQYRSEERLNKIFSSFSLIAIAIACLGLFGLASYMAERRKKEVGIRKVLGASLGEVVGLLAKPGRSLISP
jgi:putative ABC transport system permease protein